MERLWRLREQSTTISAHSSMEGPQAGVQGGDGEREASQIDNLQYRSSPPFTAIVDGERIPLRAFTQLDGFGALGVRLAYSAHDVAALLPVAIFHTGDDDVDPVAFASDKSLINDIFYGILTEPNHDRVKLAQCEVLVKRASEPSADAMVAAGVARWTGRSATRCFSSHAVAFRILELVGVATWRKVNVSDESDDDGEEAAAGGSKDAADNLRKLGEAVPPGAPA